MTHSVVEAYGVARHLWRIALAGALLLPQQLQGQRTVDIRRSAAPDIAVRVSGSYSQLKVVGWAHDSIALTGNIPDNARLEGGAGSGAAPSKGAKFWIEPDPKKPDQGTLELHVPARARVWVKTNNAVVTVEGVIGELDLNIIAGSLTVHGDPREANLESMDGTVSVVGSPTWLRIKTADGNVSVRGSVSDLAINTVSGTVTVRDGRYERARMESVTGPLTFAGDLVRSAVLTMDSHSGKLEFASSVKSNALLDIRTLTGRIENAVSPQRPTPGRDGRGEELSLGLGTGDAQVTLRTFKGSVRLYTR